MSNRYGSKERRVWAKKAEISNLVLPAIPADMVIVNGNGFINDVNCEQLVDGETGVNEIPVNNNLIIRNVGIYSNFADGLVPKDRNGELSVTVTAFGFQKSTQLTGTLTFVRGSVNVLGIGTLFTTELTPGEFIYDPTTGQGIIVQTITDNLNFIARNIPTITPSTPIDMYKVVQNGFDIQGAWRIQNLNEMIVVDQFMTPSLWATSASDITVLMARINVISSTLNTFTWLTKSIDTSFSGDEVTLDIALDIEY